MKALLLILAAMAAYGVTRLAAHGAGIPDLPGWVVPFGLGVLVGARLAFKAGQYSRAWGHSHGIWKSHKAAISGRGHH